MKNNDEYISTRYGYCYYFINSSDIALIHTLYVEPEHRRKGYATHLIKLILNEIEFIEDFHGEIQIKAEPQENSISKEDLISFYKKMGLKVLEE
jgi:GNAT superfamily N-acetyltransferase